ncbi:MAG: DUF4384 domain-containing protein [Deltaproteobacteria bacterium]|jgi:hypothetical protein|nr:DUF4384 domain-containing protein [Deltaproteobacteria bacterium]
MKLKVFLSILLLSFMTVLVAQSLQAQDGKRTTRDLVFDDEDDGDAVAGAAKDAGIENPEVISVKTTLDLTKDGQTTSVPSSHEFQNGDKIKLRFTANSDGYAYWLAKMASGKYSVLFPSPEAGSDNHVVKNENQTVPSKGFFRFDETAGTENLLLVFSKERIPELEKAIAEAATEKNLNLADTKIAALEKLNQTKRTTRDLVFDEEEEEEVSIKSQAGSSGEPFIAYYELVHK